MLIPSALFVALLVATAFIAHWSDNLGKKLGKKRVSVFGLRPRTSATLLTVASSWCIMIFTLGALLLTVTPLRNALFRYESDRLLAIEQLKAERQKTGDAQRQTQEAQREEQNSRVEAQNANVETQNFKQQTQRARRDFQEAKRGEEEALTLQQKAALALKKAQNTLKASQAQLTRTQSDLTRGRAQLLRSQQEVTRAQQDLTRAKADLIAKQQQVKTAEKRYEQAQARASSADTAASRATTFAFAAGEKQLAAEKKNREIAEDNRKLEATRGQLTNEIAGLNTQLATAKTQLIAAQQDVAYKNGVLDVLAYAPIRVPVDQTLAERRFEASRSESEIAHQLHILVDAARNAVKNAESGLVPGADFVVSAAIADTTTGNPIDLDENQAIQLYAGVLSSANQTVSARLVSAFNYPETTSVVAARFVFRPIRTLYLARENLAEATINPNKSESAVFQQLQDLVDTARRNAVKRGAYPPLSPDAQNFFDGDTGPKIFNALREVQAIGRPVTVRIVAARDLDSAEPLQVRFVIGDQTT